MKIKAAKTAPITAIDDVLTISRYLRSNFRNGALYGLVWAIGCNTGMRVGDILNLKIADVANKQYLNITESKTGKHREILINKGLKDALNDPVVKLHLLLADPSRPLIYSQKYGQMQNKAIHKVIKQTCRALSLEGNYGTHTMRKTFAYHMYQATNNFVLVQTLLNHRDTHVTKLYLPDADPSRNNPVACELRDAYGLINL